MTSIPPKIKRSRIATKTVLKLSGFLLALLALASILFSLDSGSDIKPSGASFDPSGSAAFVQLLRNAGYQVEVTNIVPQASDPNALWIGFFRQSSLYLSDAPPLPKKSSDSDKEPDPDIEQVTRRHFEDQCRDGGNVLMLGYDDKGELPRAGQNFTTADALIGPKLTLDTAASTPAGLASTETTSFEPYTIGEIPIVRVTALGKGHAVLCGPGIIAMNEFIGNKDNSKLLLNLIRMVAKPGQRVLFEDAPVTGGSEASLVQTIGTWAVWGWAQIWILLVVIFVSLGIRFGIAETYPLKQKSSRDLLDGIADTYKRSKAGKAALASIYHDVDGKLRSHFKLPKDAPRTKRNGLLPGDLTLVLSQCEVAIQGAVSSTEAADLAKRLEAAAKPILPNRPRLRRPKR